MKKLAYVTALLAAVCMISCENKGEEPTGAETDGPVQVFNPSKADSYNGYAEISVPLGTTEIHVINHAGRDAQGKFVNPTEQVIAVDPIPAKAVDGKDVEPFGIVKLAFTSKVPTMYSVYYKAGSTPATKADENAKEEDVYTLEDFPVDKIEFGAFGTTRYVQMPWSFAFFQGGEKNGQRQYPKDVVYYDAAHNHTLRYTFAYEGAGSSFGYVLTESYKVVDYKVVEALYNYCVGCGNCPYCMPWGCSCGCGSTNPDFHASGDTTGNAGEDDVVIGGEGGSEENQPIVYEGGEDGENGEGTHTPVVLVDPHGTIIVDYDNSNINAVTLPEPASYVTTSEDQTFYHSSGVVMFDDSWPASPVRTSAYDSDFNDVVVDYDIEAKTVADNILESEGWREQVKVVLHVRAIGGENPERVGLILEGFNLDNVASIEEYKTLDSWQNAHGELPTSQHMNAVKENSFQVKVNSLRPLSEVGQLFRYRETGSGAGTATYNYVNNGQSQEHVFNPALKQYAAWGGAHADQYDAAALEQAYKEVGQNFSNIQSRVFYNTVPGYVNVAGGLYTYTVIYNMKARAEMDPAAREAVKKNMIDAVVNTTSQNFYIVSKSGGQYYPIHLKGYTPADFPVKGFGTGNTYKDRYEAGKAGKSYLNATIPYCTTDNLVWAFKCPTLTKHAWEKMAFGKAYPNYEAWVRSNGAEHQDWYKDADVNGTLLTCWW
ncbi:MAG: DUF4842 domain-containing protein [Bacteroidales bacterium]|nr:DUF4842 domain-containing protein [Bacteroidales bacterium]